MGGEKSGRFKMGLLFGYLTSLISTFVITAMTLYTFLSFTGANTHQKQKTSPYHRSFVTKKLGDHLLVARAKKPMAVMADVGSRRLTDSSAVEGSRSDLH